MKEESRIEGSNHSQMAQRQNQNFVLSPYYKLRQIRFAQRQDRDPQQSKTQDPFLSESQNNDKRFLQTQMSQKIQKPNQIGMQSAEGDQLREHSRSRDRKKRRRQNKKQNQNNKQVDGTSMQPEQDVQMLQSAWWSNRQVVYEGWDLPVANGNPIRQIVMQLVQIALNQATAANQKDSSDLEDYLKYITTFQPKKQLDECSSLLNLQTGSAQHQYSSMAHLNSVPKTCHTPYMDFVYPSQRKANHEFRQDENQYHQPSQNGAHDRQKYFKTKPCYDFLNGKCRKRAQQCSFAHGPQDIRKLPIKNRGLCRNFQRGYCKKLESQCRYKHVYPDNYERTYRNIEQYKNQTEQFHGEGHNEKKEAPWDQRQLKEANLIQKNVREISQEKEQYRIVAQDETDEPQIVQTGLKSTQMRQQGQYTKQQKKLQWPQINQKAPLESSSKKHAYSQTVNIHPQNAKDYNYGWICPQPLLVFAPIGYTFLHPQSMYSCPVNVQSMRNNEQQYPFYHNFSNQGQERNDRFSQNCEPQVKSSYDIEKNLEQKKN